MTRDNSNDLADTIKTSAGDLIEELHAVRDSVEELYILLDHIWQTARNSTISSVNWPSARRKNVRTSLSFVASAMPACLRLP